MSDADNIFEVFEVTAHIKNLLENNIGVIDIKGEVSNLSQPTSGHIYFNLKDEKALIRCVFFQTYNKLLKFQPKNGAKVVVTGKISVYERDGQYQIIVSGMKELGIGTLHEQFEALKEKLRKEGLFDSEHKKELPILPSSIGIITSETGSVLQDMLNIFNRRFPVEILLYSAMVQGVEAPKTLKEGIDYFSQSGEVDLIIIGRGGGSLEDLFCFNDEGLARAIFNCTIPVISAVGHETDFTICDFVSDVRAATPSVAAELAVPDKAQLTQILQNKKKQLESLVINRLQARKQKLLLAERYFNENFDQQFVLKYQQQIDMSKIKMYKFKDQFDNFIKSFYERKQTFIRVETKLQAIENNKILLKYKLEKINLLLREEIGIYTAEIQKKKEILDLIDPKKIISKGFTIVEKDGLIIREKVNLEAEDKINILFKDGKCSAKVE